jgi:hypothetical protein
MNQKPVLEIRTKNDDPLFVKVDGKAYPLRRLRDFGLQDLHRLTQQGRSLQRAFAAVSLSPEEVEDLSASIKAIAEAVLDAPDAVHRKLTDVNRLEVASAFIRSSGLQTPAPTPKPKE